MTAEKQQPPPSTPKGVPQKLGTVGTREVETVLRRLGYAPKPRRQRAASGHLVWVKAGCHPVPVQQGVKDFEEKVFRAMLHQMGISRQEFVRLLYGAP